MVQRLLVLAADSIDRIRLRGEFASAGYRIDFAESIEDVDTEETPNAVLTPLTTTPDLQIGAIRNRLGPTPAVFGIGREGAEMRLRAVQAGFADVIEDMDLLRARLRNVMRREESVCEAERRRAASRLLGMAETPDPFAPPRTIALVGDVPTGVERAAASRRGWRVEVATVAHVLGEIHRADVYVLGPGVETVWLLPELRARSHSRRAAILVLHHEASAEDAARSLDARASDVAPVLAHPEEIALRIERALLLKDSDDALRRQADVSFEMAMTDALTGLYNRRYVDDYLSRTLSGEGTGRDSCCAMMIDIDRFKAVNDRFGHSVGDELIRRIARVLRDDLRAFDMVARLGGDEFLVVMPQTSPDEAGHVAERLRTRVAGTEIETPDGPFATTLSIGVAIRPTAVGETGSAEALLMAADAALYRAKAAGRNCVRSTDVAA